LDDKKSIIKQGDKREDFFETVKTIYNEVVDLINDVATKHDYRRIEQDGIHLISSGEVIVTASKGNESIRMP
jgi:hypothetical protein